jgi:hypothetical protein
VGSRENVNPKKYLRPPFFGSFFGRAKNEQIIWQGRKTRVPKLSVALIFLVTFFYQEKKVTWFFNNFDITLFLEHL